MADYTPGPGLVKISNDDFVQLLKGAAVTAYKGKDDPTLASAYLATVRVPDPDGAGETDALVALSGDGIVAGQTVFPVEGTLPHPVLIDLSSIGWAIQMITSSQKVMKTIAGTKADFTVALSIVGSSLNVQTLTDDFPGERDNSGQYSMLDASSYTLRDVMTDLRSRVENTIKDAKGDAYPRGTVQGFSTTQLKVMSEAEKAFKTPIFAYTLGHPAGPRVLTTGDGRWRASVPGVEPLEDLNPDMPDMEIIDLAALEEKSVAAEDTEQ